MYFLFHTTVWYKLGTLCLLLYLKSQSARGALVIQFLWAFAQLLITIIIIIIFIKTLFTFGLEHKVYKNEMITAKDKKVVHASHSRTSRLQARLRETSNQKNMNAPNRKCGKLAHFLLDLLLTILTDQVWANNHKYKYTKSKQLNIPKG